MSWFLIVSRPVATIHTTQPLAAVAYAIHISVMHMQQLASMPMHIGCDTQLPIVAYLHIQVHGLQLLPTHMQHLIAASLRAVAFLPGEQQFMAVGVGG